jgi:hypothetical protein
VEPGNPEFFPLPCANRRSLASGVLLAGFFFDGLFNLHIAKFIGVKDIATLQAFDILGVVMPGNDAYLGVFADGCHRSWYWWIQLLLSQIVSAFSCLFKPKFADFPLFERN